MGEKLNGGILLTKEDSMDVCLWLLDVYMWPLMVMATKAKK